MELCCVVEGRYGMKIEGILHIKYTFILYSSNERFEVFWYNVLEYVWCICGSIFHNMYVRVSFLEMDLKNVK